VTSALATAGAEFGLADEAFDPATTPKLTRSDLAGFDKEATDLVLEMQEYGWRGHITARGHATMRHPDGSFQSLTRASNRAKSGVAMRSRFKSWQRRRAERVEVTSAFGQLPQEPRDMHGLPVAMLADMKRHPVVGPLMTDDVALPNDVSRIVLDGSDPKGWAVFRVDRPYPELVGFGSHGSQERAWELLLEQFPSSFPEPVTQGQDEAGEQDMATVYKCPQCDDTFASHAKARSHETHKHNSTAATCPEPDCGREFKNRGAVNLHWSRTHDKAERVCPDCGRTFQGKGTYGLHRARTHAPVSEVAGDVTVAGHSVVAPASHAVTSPDVTVTSPESPASSAAHDVVMEHLENLPQGDDAEELVAAVRAIVAAPLVAELRRLRDDSERLEAELKMVSAKNVELEAKLSIMREAMAL